MSQSYPVINADGEGQILTDLVSLLDRTEALRSHFSGVAAPSDPVVGQLWLDTTDDTWYECASIGPDVWTEFLSFLPLTGGAVTGKVRFAEGAAIASASTVNLDNATGNFVHITGTTGISTLTLAQGTWMLVCFDGILTLTNGANLINQGAANITTAAGDLALFVGEGSSVTRMVGYFRASGSPVSAILSAIAALDSSAGVLVQTGAGAATKRAIGVSASTDIPDRAAADTRYQILSALLTDIATDTDTGLIEQTGAATVGKRAVGVGASTSVPTRADADGRYLRQGSFNLSLPAGAWLPRTTNPCAAAALAESTTNKRMREFLAFDGTSREYAQLEHMMPKSYSGGAIKFRVHWECSGTTSGDVVFGLQGAALADNEDIDMAWGTAVEVSDSHNGSGKRMVTAWSGNMTPSGTPAGAEGLGLQFYRKSDDVTDTINGIDVQVLAVEILFPLNAADDS